MKNPGIYFMIERGLLQKMAFSLMPEILNGSPLQKHEKSSQKRQKKNDSAKK